jgi:hypothetical protein
MRDHLHSCSHYKKSAVTPSWLKPKNIDMLNWPVKHKNPWPSALSVEH